MPTNWSFLSLLGVAYTELSHEPTLYLYWSPKVLQREHSTSYMIFQKTFCGYAYILFFLFKNLKGNNKSQCLPESRFVLLLFYRGIHIPALTAARKTLHTVTSPLCKFS